MIPQTIKPLLTDFTNKLLQNLGDNVSAVLVYGSAAGINYHPGVSNINIAVIVKKLDFAVLKQSVALTKWGHQHKIATPLFLTKDYIHSALDVFPLEFTEIKEQHKVIWGEDIFKDLQVPLTDVRLLCEQQLKGKLLHLRQAYLEIGSNPVLLKKLLVSALSDLVPVFRQLINLKGQKLNPQKEEMLKDLSQYFSLDPLPLLAIYQDKHKKSVIPSHQVESHFQNFIVQLESLARQMDAL